MEEEPEDYVAYAIIRAAEDNNYREIYFSGGETSGSRGGHQKEERA